MKNYWIVLITYLIFGPLSLVQGQGELVKAPENWRYEKLEFPLSFAPELPLQGYEEVYFAPGWDKVDSEEFWTYGFAWILEAPQDFDVPTMEQYLEDYYNGLMQAVGDFESVASEVRLEKGSDNYKGTVTTKDGFFTKSTILLNMKIEKHSGGKFWLFRISPKNSGHPVWEQLNAIHITTSKKG